MKNNIIHGYVTHTHNFIHKILFQRKTVNETKSNAFDNTLRVILVKSDKLELVKNAPHPMFGSKVDS